ncbi:MAG: hypothetical protein BGP20_04235 [Thiobacillus sp. 63-78]|uniref:hypothetical protein n=1 Tax=Thiobacillus sp. 63-78 TaxID=1895859 RepID=UPI00086A8122|nr:hypothetical protein [Thiobacillus sp. 63-78]MBN8766900.1 hypothetical protein [Thiobacillus sp.]MBN8772627.1 hypothetical protein [Thiobacillus sp.]ODV13829.1 MAG: hypothetical protein ABT22_02415 [Thiobacillus sp. SCN 64-317]OJZ12836.1 MAG: hypothetical protein BGP20_04235 [Thiobacillus sp. 63-78]
MKTSRKRRDDLCHWNYRLYREQFGDVTEITIREVYYDASGRPSGITERGVGPMGESPEELREDMAMMMSAFELPIITDADFSEASKGTE